MTTERISPFEVNNGDVIYMSGYRCVASDVERLPQVARYTLTSVPDERHPRPLPRGYEGMKSGGNEFAIVDREVG